MMNTIPSCYLLCLLLWLWPCWSTFAGKGGPGPGIDIDQAEFLLLELEVQRQLTFDFEGYLYQEELYIPATQFFDILKLAPSYHPDDTILNIRHPDTNQNLIIDFIGKQTKGFPKPVRITTKDYMLSTDEVYLRREWVEQTLNFSLVFDYRKLKLTLSYKKELPVVRDYRRKQMYSNFNKENHHSMRPDIIQPAGRHLFNGWVAGWSVNSSHNLHHQDYSYDLSLGGHLFGGDLTMHTSGSHQYGFRWIQTRGKWRFPFYNTALIQQIIAGDQNRQDVLGNSHMVYRGITITNRPKTPHRDFAPYQMAHLFKEGWDTELYVNDRLSDIYASPQPDSLDYSFPLRYGLNRFALKYFSPDGESYKQNHLIRIPPAFLPPGNVEYDITAGRYRNYHEQLFANGQLKWGIFSNMTLSGGLRFHPEADKTEKFVPFMQTWFRLGHRFIFEGTYAYNNFSGGTLNYTTPGSKRFNLNVKKYHQASFHNKLGKSLEVSANTSIPVKLPFMNLSTYVRGSYAAYHSSYFSNLYGGLSTSLPAGIQARVNSRLSFRNSDTNALQSVQHTTEVQFSKRLFWNYLLRPSFQYNHSRNQIMQSRIEVSRRVFGSGYLSFSMRYNHLIQQSSVYLRLTVNLPYARHSSYISTAQAQPTFNQSTSGTVALDQHRNTYTDRRNWIGTAVARIDSFLDLNNNDQKDKGEPRIGGLKANFYENNRTRTPVSRNRQVVKNLTPYESYLVQIEGASLDNPLWLPKYEYYQLRVTPNIVNSIPVPIQVSGEVTGTIRVRGEKGNQRMNSLDVFLYDEHDILQDTLRTYMNGSFFKMGLNPGRYTLRLNRKQLAKRFYYAVKDSVKFVVESTRQGDIVEGVDLEVTSRASSIQDPAKDNKTYVIQIRTFRDKDNASHFTDKISELTGYTTSMMYDKESRLYKSRLGRFSSPEAAWKQFDILQKNYPKLFKWSFVIDLERDELDVE